MKWKTIFKITLQHPFLMLRSLFDNDAHRIISEKGEKYLQKQSLIKMMKQDQEAGLYDIDSKDKL